ncbi:G-protein coupled receptors family 1 profile domain-containing protein [Caenorhabditis elegans]|uniref:G-protein coupled receptors family 1 profile domain-containing protein n=1 Tax=Caenorhabditis elegans TaxID=6239 RepID=Q18130_CAEEL|nr:G-protein coupled receptors family 1 profile domain-containing protein [Caenorhabditis elegans]CCD61425.1 G-protein coupled receptors family 1 profile domain-containing protein [Caenorhabditis elegans]|eukprot:NP_505381.2 Uncharacterized protein CELE_C24B5.1 [Caenorhabditis elegans]
MSSAAQLLLDSAVRDDDDPIFLYHHLNASLEAAKDAVNATSVKQILEAQTHYLFNDTIFGPSPAMESTPGRSLIQNLYYFYMPFCVFVGLTGNTMVWILIRSNRMLNKLPTNVYLLCLAAMSSIFLLSLLVFWIEEVAYIYFYDIFQDSLLRNSYYSCIFNTFLAHVCDFASVWLIVLVGLERLLLLYRKTRGLTCEKARAQVFILLGFAMVFNGWILFVADMDEEGQCDIKIEFVGMYQTMTIVETIICMLVPSVLIITCNCLVVSKLNSHIKKNPGSPAVSFNTADVVLTTQTSAPSATLKSYTRISSRFSIDVEKAPKKKKKGIRYTDIQLTRSLLVVTWAFILLNIPNYGYRIASILFGISEQSSLMTAISLGAHVFLYTHHAFLFYLYIFYSPQMKRRLKPTAMKLLECYCFKPPGDYTDHT